jgi:DNA polymerase
MTACDKKIIYDFLVCAKARLAGTGFAPPKLPDEAFQTDIIHVGGSVRDGVAPSPGVCESKLRDETRSVSSPLGKSPPNSDAVYFPTPRTLSQVPPSISSVVASVAKCDACPLCQTRRNTVPGEGVETPLVLVVGEGPGADEDESGRPFVGKAGQLLDKMLSSIELSRSTNCFIANVVKCRPPGNRDPAPEERAACAHFLDAQIAALSPRFILCAGRVAAQTMLKTENSISRIRGRFFDYFDSTGRKIPLLATFHPSYLLRDASQKRFAWEDLKTLRAAINKCSP